MRKAFVLELQLQKDHSFQSSSHNYLQQEIKATPQATSMGVKVFQNEPGR